ncbi:hypothetical protein QCA50_001933 [Cerrena zonata]|uniref:40S ribosomal protein S16 n=1 Tax=Cerrena zonata TaxID=2478898 RepID=A0AAW0GU99_9APHY
MASSAKAVQTFGKKKTATAVAHAKEGRGLIHVNGSPLNLLQPEILRFKVYEAILTAGEDAFGIIDIRVRVKGGGHTSQVYAIRQAIAKAVVAYYAKYQDAYSAMELKKKLVSYDRTLLIADPRRMEPKKFGGQGARARRQKSYVAPHFLLGCGTNCTLKQLPINGVLSFSLLLCTTIMSYYSFHALCNGITCRRLYG